MAEIVAGGLPVSGKVIALVVIVGLLAFVFIPQVQRIFLPLLTPTEKISLPAGPQRVSDSSGREVELITLLGFDSIPAILDPVLVSEREATEWMDGDEQVLGLSIDGDSRAYPIKMLSRHEIVNDVVGGKPVAVTW